MEYLLTVVLSTAAIAIVLNIFLKRLEIPTVVGYILSGAVMTTLFDLRSVDNHLLFQIAEFGIAFLMFTIGLEFSLGHLKTMKKEVFLIGGLQVIVTASVFGLTAHYLFDIGVKAAIIVGSALALSSTAIVLKILGERGELHKPHGRYALGILLFQDLAVIPMLLLITILTQSDVEMEALLLETGVDAALVLVILFLIGKLIVGRLLKFVTDSRSHEIFVGTVLLIVVSASVVAHHFGFTYSLGAFIAGLLIAETRYKYQVEADLVPFRDLLLGVFFVAVGMQIHLEFYIRRVAVKSAVSLFQVGEFSFAVLELARSNDLTTMPVNQTMIITVVFSMILTPFVLKRTNAIADWFAIDRSGEDGELPPQGLSDHMVVIGYGGLGQSIVRHLERAGIAYIAIEHDRKLVEQGVKAGHWVMFGNAAQKTILEKVGLSNAAAVIIAIDDEKKMRIISEAITDMVSDANIVVKVAGYKEGNLLEGLRIKNIVDEYDEVARILIDYAMTCEIPTYMPVACRTCQEMEAGSCQVDSCQTVTPFSKLPPAKRY